MRFGLLSGEGPVWGYCQGAVTRSLSCPRGSQGCTGSKIRTRHTAAATQAAGPWPQLHRVTQSRGQMTELTGPAPSLAGQAQGERSDSSCALRISRQVTSL